MILDILIKLKYIPIKLKWTIKMIYLIIKILKNKIIISIKIKTKIRKAKLSIKIYYRVNILKFIRLNIKKDKAIRVLILEI